MLPALAKRRNHFLFRLPKQTFFISYCHPYLTLHLSHSSLTSLQISLTSYPASLYSDKHEAHSVRMSFDTHHHSPKKENAAMHSTAASSTLNPVASPLVPDIRIRAQQIGDCKNWGQIPNNPSPSRTHPRGAYWILSLHAY